MHSPAELAAYLALTGQVLIDGPACQDFADQLSEADDLDAVIVWLKRRGGRYPASLPGSQLQGFCLAAAIRATTANPLSDHALVKKPLKREAFAKQS